MFRIPWDKEHNGCREYVNVEKKIRQTFNFPTVRTDRDRINNRVTAGLDENFLGKLASQMFIFNFKERKGTLKVLSENFSI